MSVLRLRSLLPLLLLPFLLQAQGLDFGSREAKPVPEWLPRLTIYEIWLKAFSAEGTIRGAIPRLKDVADLGATAIYLSPIAKRSGTPHASPYNVADYNAIGAEYGTEQDLRDFVGTAHKLGLKVLLDIVYYHSAPDSVVRDQPDFFRRNAEGQVVRGFWPQPLPDFQNPRVRHYLSQSLVHWVRDFDVDGFRCDVGAGVPIAFWEEARRDLDQVKRDVILLSEADRPDDQLKAFDIDYDFDYYLTLRSVMVDGNPASDIRKQWETMRSALPRGARVLRFDDNHDWRRPVLEFGEKASLLLSTLNFTLDGIPFLYNGQELGDPILTHWSTNAPIHWLDEPHVSVNGDHRRKTLEEYKKLFAMRAAHRAFTDGELLWINNSQPDSVLSFLRKNAAEEILVILNLSNRKVKVTVDLPVMDYSSVENLLKLDKTWFPLYSGRVSTELAAFDAVVGKRIPLAPLETNR